MKQTKITDTIKISGSRADNHWSNSGFQNIYKSFRRGVDIPDKLKHIDNAQQIQERFNLVGFQFGNWVTNEDRYNYLCSLYIACYDLNKILKFNKNNIGLERLSVSFGARGRSAAVAHYESHEKVINITRYERTTEVDKARAFIVSGGIGAFAHEYGHFLDYYIGQYYEPVKDTLSLTGGRSLARRTAEYNEKGRIRPIVEEILQLAYWKEPYKVKSAFITRVEAFSDLDYYVQRNEIFARLFEQYVSYKLQKAGIYNKFLSEVKYSTKIYMNSRELQQVIPLFDQVIKYIRAIS